MRFVDVSMYSSHSENLPATTTTKRKLENEGSKGKKHSKTDIKLRVRTRRITEKEKLKYDILKLKKQLHRSKISKKKLKEKLRAVESLKIAAQNIVQGMEDMNPLAKMLFKNELFNGVKKPKSRTYTEDIKNFAFKLSYYSNSAYNFLLSKNPGEEGLSLPASRSIRRYLYPIECRPGHLLQVLKIIQENIEAKKHGKRFSLVLDEMAVRRALGMNRKMKSYMGFCFLVGGEGDKERYAQKCLVFLIVCLDGSGTRYIVSYWFTDSEAGSSVSKRLTESLTLTHEHGIEIRGIVWE
jgi:hypothetical protein